jgi:hypothetical protein
MGSPRRNQTDLLAAETANIRETAKNIGIYPQINPGHVIFRLENPKSVMIVAKAFDKKIVELTSLLTAHFVDISPDECQLETENGNGLTVYVDLKLKTLHSFNYESMTKFHQKIVFWTPDNINKYAENIDFILTLGI